jgi:pimeloyl-ACP methyl ester carboxylesterase
MRTICELRGGIRRITVVPQRRTIRLVAAVTVAASLVLCASASAALHVQWMKSYASPGTPARYNKVGVLKIGPAHAKNVLVLEPGTSAGSAYFVPLAKWLVSTVKGWQVWSVERRENLLEDQSMLNLAKKHKATTQQVFDYYIGYLINPSVKHHFNPVATANYAKGWGLNVAVQDLHTVISAARKLGGKVVLGGHSLGGSVVTGYATWNFHGRPGADQLAGLVYDDGASFGAAPSAQAATQTLQTFESPSTSPWLPFVAGIPPWDSGLFGSTGGLSAILDPNQPLANGESALLPAALKTPVPVTNLAEFGWGTSVATSQLVFAIKAHDGAGLDARAMPDGLHGWNSAGSLTPIKRYAQMLSGYPLQGVDGTEWYFPQRLTDDSSAIDNGNANPAQAVFGIKDTMGHRLPRRLRMYAFGAFGGTAITSATSALAAQSGIPKRNLTLISRHATYAHNDPAGAFPNNVFFTHLVSFLKKIAPPRHRHK